MLNVSGLNDTGKNVIAPNRKPQTPYDAIVKKVRQQRAMAELKEIEAIQQKPKEERTFAENVKLASYQLDRTLAALDEIPTVIYVA